MADWVVADIHGCFLTFKKLVEEEIKLTKEDHLFLLGDMIDRGKKVKETLDYIIALQYQGFQVAPLMGNHEYFFITAHQKALAMKNKWIKSRADKKYITQWLHTGGQYTLDSLQIESVTDVAAHYLQFLQDLPLYIQTDKYLFTHAGINTQAPDPYQDVDSLLFGSNEVIDTEKIGRRLLLHGHTVVALETIEKLIQETKKYHYICLDNGCVYIGRRDNCGNLLALNLDTMNLLKQINIEE